MQQAFRQALPVLKKLEAAGHEAYFVGGCVRDALRGQQIADVDIATSAYPQEVQQLFPKHFDVGLAHGTVMIRERGETYEITTFRTESTYQDYRRPDSVTFVRSLEEDLQRRDFTVNALAMDCRGRLYDFHQGQSDLANRILRTVGQADERFSEDALRMMRAVRFVSQLGFSLSDETIVGIQKNASLLEKIAVERVREEWLKLLKGPNATAALEAIIHTQLYRYMPLRQSDAPAVLTQLAQLPARYEHDVMCWAVLLFFMADDLVSARTFLSYWKLSTKQLEQSLAVYQILQQRPQRQWDNLWLFQVGLETATIAEKLAHILQLIVEPDDVLSRYQQLPIHATSDLVISGADVIACCCQTHGGPYVGQLLKEVQEQVLTHQLSNDANILCDWVRQRYATQQRAEESYERTAKNNDII